MAIGLPVRKYVDEEDSKFGPPSKPFEFDNIEPKNIRVVFECEDCGKKETDDVSNIAYNGAPVCECGDEMMLSHCKVIID